ncbi:MAG: pitrilysin family protein, partial [Chloroflexota bacterium]|nr:pitrilysin family protein [Chloroflexota bacterium]
MPPTLLKNNPDASTSSTHSLPGPDDIMRVVLPNGIVVLGRANFNSPSVVINGYLPAGGINDPDKLLGLADFCASALMRGTDKRDFFQIYDLLESAGASLGIGGGVHLVSYSGRALVEDIDLLLELLAESLRQPIFPDEQVERLRTQILTGLAIRSQQTRAMASLTFDQIVYDGHPYSRPEEGYPETVSAISREDLVGFHQRNYGPRGMVVTVVGAVDPGQIVDQIARFFGDWQNPQQPEPTTLPPLKPLPEVVQRGVEIPGKSQADIVLGAAGPARSAADYVAASLGNSVLGQFGMMGRIGASVRDQAGLAYYAYSSLGGGLGPGPWYVSA